LILSAATYCTLCSILPSAFAQAYPNRAVRWVVPFAVGTAPDLLARVAAQQLSAQWGQPVIVVNRAGAGGSVGAAEVAKAVPDGYTLLVTGSSSYAAALPPQAKSPAGPAGLGEGLMPVAHLADAANLLLVPMALPVKNVKDLIALAKRKPGELNFASGGNGTLAHLTGEAFNQQAGVVTTHIPYRVTSMAMPDLIAGNVHLMFDSLASGLPHVQAGRLRALAVTGRVRSVQTPELPTLAESGVTGLSGFESVAWFGLFGPAGLPPAVVNKLSAEINTAVQAKNLREQLLKLGSEAAQAGSPARFGALIEADSERWNRLIRERKINQE
jgi:tripartite-type tricarboxylate transporter receptor subunit TctC